MHRSTWQQFPDHRYTVQLTNKQGQAVPNVKVWLSDGQRNVIWQSVTDVFGHAELWAHYFAETPVAARKLQIGFDYQGESYWLGKPKPFSEGINFHTLAAPCLERAVVDIAFVVDATGSMGDEISYLQAELADVIAQAKAGLPDADLQLGSVFYRDQGDQYLTKQHPLTNKTAATINFIQQQNANGGGDFPEAVDAAMNVALDSMNWRANASSRLLFLLLDAPPHETVAHIKRMQVAVTKAAMQGIQIIPVACSGVNKSTEYLMRALALATNGTYTFLTDHSGIGNAHIEPSTDSYKVEQLNEVLLRLIIARSQLGACTAPPIDASPWPKLPLASNEQNRSWSFFPNPTSGPVTVECSDETEDLYLIDNHGKILQRFSASTQLVFDISSYPAGTYYLRMGDEASAIILQAF